MFGSPIYCNMSGFSLLHCHPEFAQSLVHWVNDAIQPSYPVTPFSSCPQSFPALESFPVSQLFTSGGQNIGASTLASVLPMNIQDWFSLGLPVLISLLSMELSWVFSSTAECLFFNSSRSFLKYFFITSWSIPLFYFSISILFPRFGSSVLSLLPILFQETIDFLFICLIFWVLPCCFIFCMFFCLFILFNLLCLVSPFC